MRQLIFGFERRGGHANLIPIIETIRMFKDNFMGVGNTISGKLSNEEIALEVFANSNLDEFKIIEDFSNYKLFLSEYNGDLGLKTINKVFNNRWADP